MKRSRKPRHPASLPPKPAPLERFESGIPRLDYILKGGFVRGGTYTVTGPPGSGKTIFANQACFQHIARHRKRCVYFTLMAETHAKMIRHLETLEFFDPRCLPDQLTYVSAYRALKDEGLPGLLSLFRSTLKSLRPSFIVIDGVHVVQKVARAPQEFDELLHELQAFTSITETTTLLLTPTFDGNRDNSENVVVDGVIELSYQLFGPRVVRELTVHKFRGTDHMLGRHEVEITSEGIQIHPRTEVQFDQPLEQAEENRIRMAFGVKQLDQMLRGGLLSGTSTTLLGSPGTGKTLLGLSFLAEGAKQGQRGLYFGFYEPPPRLIEKAERVGIPLRKYCKQGLIELLWQPPLEHFMDSLAEQLLEKLRADGQTSKRRLFIDGAEGFRAAAIYPDRMPRFISALANQLRMLDVTTVISEELDLFKPEVDLPNAELATVNEGVILLRYVEQGSEIRRLVSVLKMRESEYDTSIYDFEITAKGMVVNGPFDSGPLLSGGGRILAGVAGKPSRGGVRR